MFGLSGIYAYLLQTMAKQTNSFVKRGIRLTNSFYSDEKNSIANNSRDTLLIDESLLTGFWLETIVFFPH